VSLSVSPKSTQSSFLSRAENRHIRKRTLLAYVVKNTKDGESLSVEKMIGVFSWEWGVGTRTIQDYFLELQRIGAISTSLDKVVATAFGKKLIEQVEG